eukprot:TRINITY_DN14322_c0_g1_i4.p1 TRINITY_DN14322_c0_g1~~TRINITY_DN14322_c0_g1_i4.p1  ORF type:complete len:538 (+),score=100.69 TRINITY_DN14322_c0_g1_i4:35-1648(+)
MCIRSYGFLPCADDALGALCLIIAYGFLMLKGANFLSDGSELLLAIVDPGVIGGLLLPLLGALPDSIIIIVSGLGSKDQVQNLIAVGMGTLAGSSIMLLTITWGISLLVGRCDLDYKGKAMDKKLSSNFDFINTGVTTDLATRDNALIMMLTVSLFFIIQIPSWVTHHKDEQLIHWFALAGYIACFIALIAYSVYQVVQPDLQRRRIDAARNKRHRYNTITKIVEKAQTYGGLVDENGKIKSTMVNKLFEAWDTDHSGRISTDELRGMLLGLDMAISADNAQINYQTGYLMKEFDIDHSKDISREELQQGLSRWVKEKQKSIKKVKKLNLHTMSQHNKALAAEIVTQVDRGLLEEQHIDEHEEEEDEIHDAAQQLGPGATTAQAILYLIISTVLCAVFSDPLVKSMSNFADAINVGPFYVAFVIAPFASNASEFVSSLQFAAKKKMKNISLTFSQVYGAVAMNNTLGLGLFLVLIFHNNLEWQYSSEVIAIICIALIIGVLGYLKVTFRSYLGFVALALYPLAILLVYVLDEVLHLK